MQNTKQKKKVSYDDILASLKMSVNGNGKLEIVRTDADETKLKDQLVQKYTKPVKPNNSRPALEGTNLFPCFVSISRDSRAG